MDRKQAISRAQEAAENAAGPVGLEVVEVELKGSGRNQLLRIVIDRPEGGTTDKPEGVTHGDCELISRAVGDALDAEDPIEGTYQLEVTSPGVERKLIRWRDWERFAGKKAKVVLREPVEDLKHFDGIIAKAEGNHITIDTGNGRHVTFPLEQVERANLKFEW